MTLTSHAQKRMQQRGVPPLILDWLIAYGSSRPAGRGATLFFFDRDAKRRLERDVGRLITRKLSEYLNCYAVFRDDVVITTGKRFRPVRGT